ncbi:MAG: arsenate reductase ArsC [Campylobacterota bacterium]|nr:arsenate reductase ArsC [Campylobacterota bacterium]
MKKVLILCTGNSCRSIMAEAVVNYTYPNEIQCYSSGVKASGSVNENAIKALMEFGIDTEGLHSKTLDTMMDIDYDLVVTVCDHANETCPLFPKGVQTLHVGIVDPTGKKFYEYLKTLNEIKTLVLPKIEEALRN